MSNIIMNIIMILIMIIMTITNIMILIMIIMIILRMGRMVKSPAWLDLPKEELLHLVKDPQLKVRHWSSLPSLILRSLSQVSSRSF